VKKQKNFRFACNVPASRCILEAGLGFSTRYSGRACESEAFFIYVSEAAALMLLLDIAALMLLPDVVA